MFKTLITKFFSNPISFTNIVFRKLFLDPIKYKNGVGYNAEQYWKDRFVRYKTNIKGPGDEGASKKNNIKRYEHVTNVFTTLCKTHIKEFKNLKVLEIGTGTGLITKAISQLEVKNYVGIDITDCLFPILKKEFPDYKFKKLDITATAIDEKFDLIVIIDVIEHIVEDEKFSFAMTNLKNSLLENGKIIIAPIVKQNFKAQFYERHWTMADLKKIFFDFKYAEPFEWKKNFSKIYLLKKS